MEGHTGSRTDMHAERQTNIQIGNIMDELYRWTYRHIRTNGHTEKHCKAVYYCIYTLHTHSHNIHTHIHMQIFLRTNKKEFIDDCMHTNIHT